MFDSSRAASQRLRSGTSCWGVQRAADHKHEAFYAPNLRNVNKCPPAPSSAALTVSFAFMSTLINSEAFLCLPFMIAWISIWFNVSNQNIHDSRDSTHFICHLHLHARFGYKKYKFYIWTKKTPLMQPQHWYCRWAVQQACTLTHLCWPLWAASRTTSCLYEAQLYKGGRINQPAGG